MEKLPGLLKELRGKESLRSVGERAGLSHNYLSQLEKGIDPRTKKPIKPTPDTLKRLSEAYDYSYDELLKLAGYIEDKEATNPPRFTQKDELDIAKRVEEIRKDLISANKDGDGLNFYGEPMSEEAIDSLLEAMEYAVRQTQRINKKYIPKKYKDNDNKD
ncbi:hypothetical protein AWH48_12255 [Domibacillus aminovorans]|uniref:HTH cro/C1-type domain-containing protein n=1 Tax=Domibacillus aminovorans TaxID=29332 RepID=A0A177KI92_9BACI|nr:helix-turn-helix transcriptional regulator [Domibacillus aminovorans]OAH53122.1 hypothetical protein AWH48_12255 [Domibacillus aminovorans]